MKTPGELKRKIKLPPIAFMACLTISGLAWLIISLSKEYSRTLTFHLNCTEVPDNKTIKALSDSIVMLRVHARGFGFLKPVYAGNHRNINLSVKKIIQKNQKKNVYTIHKNDLSNYLRAENGFDSDLVEIIEPETVTIYLK
jgi:hypothetical protein